MLQKCRVGVENLIALTGQILSDSSRKSIVIVWMMLFHPVLSNHMCSVSMDKIDGTEWNERKSNVA